MTRRGYPMRQYVTQREPDQSSKCDELGVRTCWIINDNVDSDPSHMNCYSDKPTESAHSTTLKSYPPLMQFYCLVLIIMLINISEPMSSSKPLCSCSLLFFVKKRMNYKSCLELFQPSSLYSQDDLIEKEKTSYAISGGCCALAAIYLMGKLYVANAGDSRAIIIRNNEVIPMTNEFTPESERQRLQYL
ncbi:hypothetical protein XENOCAPTIV_020792, partial [Xenoophorus captivus]